jgi:hypothetical protein
MQEDQRTQGQKFEDLSKELGCDDDKEADQKLRQLLPKVAALPKEARPDRD